MASVSRKVRNITAPVTKAAKSPEPQRVALEYIKSNLFRVIHADGAIGGVTPAGNIHVAFYSERPAIPRMTVHLRADDGTLGAPIPDQTVSRAGFIREMDIDIVFNRELVPKLIEWLLKAKTQAEQHVAQVKQLQRNKQGSKDGKS